MSKFRLLGKDSVNTQYSYGRPRVVYNKDLSRRCVENDSRLTMKRKLVDAKASSKRIKTSKE
ncbi:MAG: hypothetical protein WA667_29475 [Candidatus Nitrosopolaris sp.]